MSVPRGVRILAGSFFDPRGEDMYFGGAERYLVELARVVRETGHEVDVFQAAESAWTRDYHDLRVTGVDTGGDPFAVSEAVSRLDLPEPLLTIHLAFYLARAPPSRAQRSASATACTGTT